MLAQEVEPELQIAIAAIRDQLGVADAGEFVRAIEANLSLRTMYWMVESRLGGVLLDGLWRYEIEDKLPEEERATVRRIALSAVTDEAVRLRTLARALPLLEQAGFSVYAIKGVALSASMPEHSALRHSCDVDLWVPGPAAGAANELLMGKGFTLCDNVTPEDPRKWHCQPLRSPEGIMVELHRRPWVCPRELATGPTTSMRFDHALVPGGVPTPGIEEQITIHAVHAALNRVSPGHMVTLWDIAALAHAFEVDWSAVADLSRRLAVMRGVKSIMSRVALLGFVPVPAEVRMSPGEEERLVLRAEEDRERASTLRAIWLRKRAVDNLSNWLGSAWVALPPLPPADRRLPGLVTRRVSRGAREVMQAIRRQ
jgi:hypothetical protein